MKIINFWPSRIGIRFKSFNKKKKFKILNIYAKKKRFYNSFIALFLNRSPKGIQLIKIVLNLPIIQLLQQKKVLLAISSNC